MMSFERRDEEEGEIEEGDDANEVNEADNLNPQVERMMEMGFPQNWCEKALVVTDNRSESYISFLSIFSQFILSLNCNSNHRCNNHLCNNQKSIRKGVKYGK